MDYRALLGACTAAGILIATGGSQAAQLDISQQPLFLLQTVAPNLILTLDNSQSMRWAFVPDAMGDNVGEGSLYLTRRVKSASYNPMYYDPKVTYQAPKKVIFSGGQLLSVDYPVSAGDDTFDFTRVYVNGFNPARGTLDLSKNYRVTWQYKTNGPEISNYGTYTNEYAVPKGSLYSLAPNPAADFKVGSVDRTRVGVPAYYYVYDPSLASNCNAENDACYRLVTVSATSGPDGTDERKNFATWYAFYRIRGLAMQSAANRAFLSLPENIRLTWQDLGYCKTLSGTSGCKGISYSGENLLAPFSGEHRANFFGWAADIGFDSGTPLPSALIRAGEFLRRKDVNNPYALVPGVTQAPEYTCRASYHLLMTDGIWVDSNTSVGNADNTGSTLPDGTRYTPRPPFADVSANSLADVAFKYWASDARPDLADNLKPYTRNANGTAAERYWDPGNDPATWQHLVNFTVGLGLGKSLTRPAWGGSTYAGDYTGLLDGSIGWPPVSSNSPNNVYDLWHAALNSRGEFFSADTPEQLVGAFNSILTRISSRNTSAARPAVISPTSESAETGAFTYTPSFSSEDWSGDLIKYRQDPVSGTQAQVWSAKARLLQREQKRGIWMRGRNGNLVEFTWSNLNSEQQAAFNRTLDGDADSLGSARVDYLRGDRSKEGTLFRSRQNLLGDIVGSAPVVVAAPSRPAYLMNALDGQGSYSDFKDARKNRATRIYVGANDGMLHAFDPNGEETFAFVPTAALEKMNRIPDRKYTGNQHQYFVDGPLVTGDVYFGGAWHSVLVGSLGGGGRSMFALDITDPANIRLLWEISAGDSAYRDLGYTLTKPSIARLHDGRWAVVAANGYDSIDDHAVLYLVDIGDGSLIKSIPVSDGGSAPNGLSTPRVVDMDGDGIADYAYAGDIRGNLWRFDLFAPGTPGKPYGEASSFAATSSFRASFGGAPLFQAVSGSGGFQPITSAPRVARHPGGTGLLVIFGTGKYFETSDAVVGSGKAMSLYGIWDRQTAGESALSTPSVTRSRLQEQTLVTKEGVTIGNGTRNIRIVSDKAVAWTSTSAGATVVEKYGWYLDLPDTGERIVSDPTTSGNLLLITTLAPRSDPCEDGVRTWLMALNPLTGGAPDMDALDLNHDGTIDELDRAADSVIVSGIEFPGITGGLAPGLDSEHNLVGCGSDGCLRIDDGIRPGRLSWRRMRD
ncbi:pilus assembly protein [Pseudomonas schmalbachii]|uniref:Pilus assembly protein PilY n=1 Tax=Pseudomonas schmalbachii TaxID=2816993 RepID=A0ABS3TRT7_9PSED|nr:PilC/PilY family type IV pilus protein [Pseudomonas schmalbachii]MBO3275294.1 pilus assembly protein PilY [Pseudomonas schmalbachii]